MGKGCAQSGGGPIPAPLGFSGYISLHTNPFCIVHLAQLYILVDHNGPAYTRPSTVRYTTAYTYTNVHQLVVVAATLIKGLLFVRYFNYIWQNISLCCGIFCYIAPLLFRRIFCTINYVTQLGGKKRKVWRNGCSFCMLLFQQNI